MLCCLFKFLIVFIFMKVKIYLLLHLGITFFRCQFLEWETLHCGSFLGRTHISSYMTTFWAAQTAYMSWCSVQRILPAYSINNAASGWRSCKHGYHPLNHQVTFIASLFTPSRNAIEISVNALLPAVCCLRVRLIHFHILFLAHFPLF